MDCTGRRIQSENNRIGSRKGYALDGYSPSELWTLIPSFLSPDVLPFQTFKALPQHSSPPVTSLHLIESSDALREEQKQKLKGTGFGEIDTQWWGSVDEVPPCELSFVDRAVMDNCADPRIPAQQTMNLQS